MRGVARAINRAWIDAIAGAMIARMDRAARFPIRRYDSPEAMKAEEYDYWRRRPAQERMEVVAEISAETYGLNGLSDASRLQRTLVHLKR